MAHVSTDFYKKNPHAILLDCRFNMAFPEQGRESYNKEHIKGAIYVDLDKDMMGKLGEHGGRHPLPNMDVFRKKMESLGISDDSTVIIYDDGEFPVSCRLCFMLKMLGKESFIINGGYDALLDAGFEKEVDIPTPKAGKLNTKANNDILVDIDYILKNRDNSKVAIVDSRDPNRYNGLMENIDWIAGRIPGALNIFWKNAFNGKKLKSEEELKEVYKDLATYDEVAFYCGSGVTGAVNAIIYDGLGGKNVKLYGGSFSDYISYDGLELIIKDNEKIIIKKNS